VTLATIGTADIRVQVPAIGTVVPRNQAVVRARVDGPLLEVAFTEGKPVAAGEVLARIDPEPFKAALAQARGQLARTRRCSRTRSSTSTATRACWPRTPSPKQQVDTQAALVQQYRAPCRPTRRRCGAPSCSSPTPPSGRRSPAGRACAASTRATS
jgi:multidrug efflux system membrane fusion protein